VPMTRRRSLDAIVAILTFSIMLLFGAGQMTIIGILVRSQFDGLERAETADALGRVQAALEGEREALASMARDYAAWDEARAYVEGANPGFAEKNFTAEWADVNTLDRIIVVSPEAIILWGGLRSSGTFGPAGPASELAPGKPYPPLESASAGVTRFDLLWRDGSLFIECAYPVTSSDYSAPPLGWICFARPVDAAMLRRISDNSGTRVSLRLPAEDFRGARPFPFSGIQAAYLDMGDERRAIIPLNDGRGRQCALITADFQRRLIDPRRRLMVWMALSLAAGFAASAGVLLGILRLVVVKPLTAMALELKRLAADPAPGARIGLGSNRRDEIGTVSDGIDSLLHALEDERAALLEANRELERLSQIDHLTGLANRRRFEEYARREVRRMSRSRRDDTKKETMAVIIADIDHFKLYNDCRGHLEGDKCIRSVAEVLAAAVRRPTDMPCRFGGEEFIVLLPETDLRGAMTVAANIRAALEAIALPFAESPVRPIVTMSFGVAAARVDESFDLQALIRRADAAMYEVKRSGRDAIRAAGDGD